MNKHIGGFLGMLKNARPGWSGNTTTTSTPASARPVTSAPSSSTTQLSQNAERAKVGQQTTTISSATETTSPTVTPALVAPVASASSSNSHSNASVVNGFKPLHTVASSARKETTGSSVSLSSGHSNSIATASPTSSSSSSPPLAPSKNLFAKRASTSTPTHPSSADKNSDSHDAILPSGTDTSSVVSVTSTAPEVDSAKKETASDAVTSNDSVKEFPSDPSLDADTEEAPPAKRVMDEEIPAALNGEESGHAVDENAIALDASAEQDAVAKQVKADSERIDALNMPPPQTVPKKDKTPRKPRAKKTVPVDVSTVEVSATSDAMLLDESQATPAPKKQRRRPSAKASASETSAPSNQEGDPETTSSVESSNSSSISIAPKKPRKPRAPRKPASVESVAPTDDVQVQSSIEDAAQIDQQAKAKKPRKPRAKKAAPISADDILVDEDGIYVKMSRATVKDEYAFDDGFAVRDEEDEEQDTDADFVLSESYEDEEEASIFAESTLSSYGDDDRDLSYDESHEAHDASRSSVTWSSHESETSGRCSTDYPAMSFEIDVSNILPARSVRKRTPVRTEYALLVSSREKAKLTGRGARRSGTTGEEDVAESSQASEDDDDEGEDTVLEVEGGVQMVVVDSDDEHEFVHIAELDNPSAKRAARKLAKALQDANKTLPPVSDDAGATIVADERDDASVDESEA